MASTILATKLYIPPPPPKVVVRPRLIERLNEGLHRKLTLISAPAGFGKTTLVSAWVAGCEQRESKVRAAWLSLDEGDNDPTRFLTYLVTALQTIAPDIGTGLLSVLQSPQPPPPEVILTALLNEITAISDHFVLVLDDYHLIDAQPIDDALTFLLEHMPPQMHLVITTREDPQLPLARLRARAQLTELRASDLRFTNSEAAKFLHAMSLNLSEEDVAALEDRTEGWIAGLQLAAISLRGHQDIPTFIQAFAGDHRYIVDYLVEEVLQRQPESIRRFLLQTSILDRLNGPLCDAVTGQAEGSARLQALERGNFFVIPLDGKRYWYRYHHLFAEVLYAHLIAEQRDLVPTLHWRASEWYEHHGSVADAIRHALAAEDFERAANLVELAVPAIFRSRQEAVVLGWLRALPDEVIHFRPVLSVWYAHALLASGELEGVEGRLRDAERWLDTPDTPDTIADRRARPEAPAAAMVVVDEEEFRRLSGAIAIARAGLALVLGDVPATVKYARRVLDLVPEDDTHLWRGAAVALLGLAYWASGDLETAHRAYAEGMAHVQRAGHISDALNGAIARADIRIAQGRLREAMRTYEQALQLATEQTAQGAPVLRGTADLYVGISELERERNDLNAATQHLLRSKELGGHIGLPQNQSRWCVAMSRIREAQGDLEGALDLLNEAERLYVSDFSPNARPVAALKTRVWVAQGMLGEALVWVRERGLSVKDDLSYLREFEHITLARLLLAQYKSDHGDRADRSLRGALDLLERLLQAAEGGERTGSVIEILVLQALAHQAQGDMTAALTPLQRALTLAEPEGYVRIFVDEGPLMAQLLLEAAARGLRPDYIGKLMRAFEGDQQQGSRSGAPSGPWRRKLREGQELAGRSAGESSLHTLPTFPTSDTSQSLTEPLSPRELEVLRLFQTELTGPEIASELVIALSTLRTHTKGIYSKLNVNSRRAAVKRAAELDLIKPR